MRCPHGVLQAGECPECSPPTMREDIPLELPSQELETLRGQYYAVQSLLVSARERITELEGDLNRAYRDMEYEDWRQDPDDFWARAERERAGQ